MKALLRKRLQREQGAPNDEVNIPARSSSYPGTLKLTLKLYLYLYNALGLSFGVPKQAQVGSVAIDIATKAETLKKVLIVF